MREIVFDTETTGLDARNGDRLVEIGGVELLNHIPTGRTFHRYLNPGRPVHPDAVAVHGLTDAFLADKPRFEEVVDEFLDFVGDSALVAHNAGFDREFINAELERAGRPALPEARFVDTLMIARRRHPGASNSLDALCARYGIDSSARTKHGALLDAEILADVYLELLGGRQAMLALSLEDGAGLEAVVTVAIERRPHPLPPRLTEADRQAHRAFVAGLCETPVWARYWGMDRS
jgi:DNA polymerase-3 subunit epsilon